MMKSDNNDTKITEKELKSVFWRMQLFQGSWNYERMQALGFLFSMKPVLKKVYKNRSKEEKAEAIKRHLEFFNTHPTLAAPILGVTSAMEEEAANEAGTAISSIKVGAMGPLAGLGDSIIWLTWMPICMSIGASFAKQGNPVGLILALVLFNVVNIPLKYWGIKLGYEKGLSFIKESKDSKVIQRFTTMATIMGLVLVGGLVPQMVNIKIPYVLQVGQVKVVFQQILDGIMPSLLAVLVTFLCFRLLKKGKNAVVILLAIIVLSILGKVLGLLG